MNGSLPEPVEVEKAEPVPVVVEKPKPKAKAKTKAKTKAKVEEPEAVEIPNISPVIICIGCGPSTAPAHDVRFLSQILMSGPVGKSIAKSFGVEDYCLAPCFERRDLVRHNAAKICKALVGKILVIDSDNVDEREVASSFVSHASLVIRS